MEFAAWVVHEGGRERAGAYAEVEEAIDESKRTTNPEELVQKVQEVQRLLYEKGPAYLPIFTWIDFIVYHGFVKNIPAARGLGTTGRYLSDWWLDL